MKQKWKVLVESIQKLIDDDAVVMNGLRNGSDINKIKKRIFNAMLKIIGVLIEEFGMFVPDPERDEIELPFDSVEFSEAWSDYKEFLFEVYNIVLVPVEERLRLKSFLGSLRKMKKRHLNILNSISHPDTNQFSHLRIFNLITMSRV